MLNCVYFYMYNIGSLIKIYIIKYVKLFNIFIGNKNKWNII